MDEAKVGELTDIFKELADTAGGYERTRIMPNLEVIDTAPSGLPANFIIIKDDEGFYIPALKVAGMTYTNGDLVNVLFIKGAEPIAFQHGSSGSGGYAVHISDEGVDQGNASTLDFVGTSVTAAVAAGVATITVAGGGSGQNFQLYHNGVATEYATLALAIAAAVSGDTIVVYPGAYTANDVTLPDGCNLVVVDPENTVFSTSTSQYCIRTGIASYLLNVRCQVTTSHAAQVGAIYITGNDAILENCTAIGSNSHATGFSYGFYQADATGVELRNCYGDGTGATSNDNYGYRMDYGSGGTGTVKVIGGQYLGDASALYCDGTSLQATLPRLNQMGASSGGGTYSGNWLDTSGNINFFGSSIINGLDKAKVSQLWESDGGAVAAQTDAAGNLTLNGTSDVFPQASVNGLNTRFERLFGDDVPGHITQYSRRIFTTNDYANNRAGFEVDANPFSFGASPGNFSLSLPADSYACYTSNSWLYLQNYHAGSPLVLKWSSTTAKNYCRALAAVMPLQDTGVDRLVAAIRGWAVQTPTTQNFWEVRWYWYGATKPQHPLWFEFCDGSGTTFPGVVSVLAAAPTMSGLPVDTMLRAYDAGGGAGGGVGAAYVAEGFDHAGGAHAAGAYPVSFKELWFYIPPATYQILRLDDIRIT